jgi:hypothetical protein
MHTLQHYLNPLHLYCRLCELGVSATLARTISSGYERIVYRPLATRQLAARG